MSDIMVTCPQTGKPVPTGLKAEWVRLDSLPPVAVPVLCTACGQTHKWQRDQAWIGSAAPPPVKMLPLAEEQLADATRSNWRWPASA